LGEQFGGFVPIRTLAPHRPGICGVARQLANVAEEPADTPGVVAPAERPQVRTLVVVGEVGL
jgi:hypothetical protein